MSLRLLPHLDRRETFRNKEAFPLWLGSFGRGWMQQPRSDVGALKHSALRTQPTRQQEQRALIYSATGTKRRLVKMDDAYYLYFICVVSNIWGKCSSAQMSMRRFTSSLNRVNLRLLFCSCRHHHQVVPQCKARPACMRQQHWLLWPTLK